MFILGFTYVFLYGINVGFTCVFEGGYFAPEILLVFSMCILGWIFCSSEKHQEVVHKIKGLPVGA